LAAGAEKKRRDSTKRFFKEQIKVYGVKTATVEKIARSIGPQSKPTESLTYLHYVKSSEFRLHEEAFIVSDWMPKYIHYLELRIMAIFKRWIECYVNNWANATLLQPTH